MQGRAYQLALLLTVCLASAAAAVERAELDKGYRVKLEALAAKCDELARPEEAALTRAWFIERPADRQVIFVPPERAPQPLAKADERHRQWHAKFLSLRAEQADALFQLAKDYLAAGDATRSFQALYETLRENPDHAEARAVLGYRKADGVWRVPGASTGVRKASLQHGLIKDFRPGAYWRVTTPHFQIATSAGTDAGQKFGDQLEMLYTVWRQVFFNYWSSAEELQERFARPAVEPKLKKPFDVVLFKNRDEYLANLASAEPQLAITQGFYSDKKSTAFFFAGDAAKTAAICNHEVTHQLFQESSDAARDIGARGNFWIVEGIALYMESLRTFEHAGRLDHVTLGGWDADRLQFARHHVFNGRFQMPLADLTAFTREGLQKDKDIKRLYSQSAGMAHYLMDGASGKHREATVKYLSGVYAGHDDPDLLAKLTETPFAGHDHAYRDYLQVRDEDLLAIKSPERIRNLCLGLQPISDAGLAKVGGCTNLQWLDLAASKVTDTGLAHLAGLKKLDQLNLEQTAASDATLALLGKLPQLRELDLSGTAITDTGLAKLAPLTNLEVLWLTGTPITDASLPILQRFKKLKTLDLDGTKLSDAAKAKLAPNQ